MAIYVQAKCIDNCKDQDFDMWWTSYN